MIYMRLVTGITEESRLKIDALLGDAAARAELDARRTAAIGLIGAEVG